MRRGSSSRASSDFLSNLGGVHWPTLVKPAYRRYVSVLEPQISAQSGLQPDLLKAILQPSAFAALHALRSKITAEVSDEPQLTGATPAEPVHPGEPPPLATEPKWQDFEPQKRYSGWLERLRDVLSGAAWARDREARAKLNSASASWRIEGSTRQRAERNYRERLQRYEHDIVSHRHQKAVLESDLRSEQQHFESYVRRFREAQSRDTDLLDALFLNALSGYSEGIEGLAAHILQAIPMPVDFEREIDARFDNTDRILLLSLRLPNIEEIGLHVPLKTKIRDATEK